MKETKKQRGLFEKMPGSGAWWIRYADTSGRIRREKAGTRGAALKLYQKRKTEILQRKNCLSSCEAESFGSPRLRTTPWHIVRPTIRGASLTPTASEGSKRNLGTTGLRFPQRTFEVGLTSRRGRQVRTTATNPRYPSPTV
jgi:hypothetical protein